MVGIREKLILGTLALISLVGFGVLTDYSVRPAPPSTVKTSLSSLDLNAMELDQDERSCVFLFYHPHCPCTLATARNLERLRSAIKVPVSIHAYAFCPSAAAVQWIESETTRTLQGIEDLTVFPDYGGQKCREYGALTSGQVCVYSPAGQLVFSGGLSSGRGHEGENISTRHFIEQLNDQTKSNCIYQPVFGCHILPTSSHGQSNENFKPLSSRE